MVHHLPYHVRADLHTSLQIFAAHFKFKQTILPMALLINAAAIVQPPLQLDHRVPSFSDSSSLATDPSDARQITYGCVQLLPVATATAMVARQYPSDSKRVSVPVSLNAGACRDDRFDPVAVILAQTSIAALLLPPQPSPWRIFRKQWPTFSQDDRHTRLTCSDDEERPGQPCRTAYYLLPTGPQRTQPHPMRIPS
jgi:hypothetical protein